MLLGTSLLGNLVTGEEQVKERLQQARIFMLPSPLTNFEVQKHQNEPKFNVCPRNNLPNITDGAYEINLIGHILCGW